MSHDRLAEPVTRHPTTQQDDSTKRPPTSQDDITETIIEHVRKPGQTVSGLAFGKRPPQDSNLRTRLRRPSPGRPPTASSMRQASWPGYGAQTIEVRRATRVGGPTRVATGQGLVQVAVGVAAVPLAVKPKVVDELAAMEPL